MQINSLYSHISSQIFAEWVDFFVEPMEISKTDMEDIKERYGLIKSEERVAEAA